MKGWVRVKKELKQGESEIRSRQSGGSDIVKRERGERERQRERDRERRECERGREERM